jgi:hypothetical protein
VASPSLKHILRTLVEHRVEFILVGGLAAVAQGASITTMDVDIVHRRTPDNVDRLIAMLQSVNARYRGRPGGAPLPPTAEILRGTGHSLLHTDLGPLDVLGAIEGGRDYDALLPDSLVIMIGADIVRVLRLEIIVAIKRASTHPKDQRALPILEAALARRDIPED